MKQIRTVIKPYHLLCEFDTEVNALLGEGWNLQKRELRQVPGEISEAFSATSICVLYAELDRTEIAFEEITL